MKNLLLKSVATVLVAFGFHSANAQDFHKAYSWDSTSTLTEIDSILLLEPSVILKNHITYDYYYDPEYNRSLVEIYSIHRRIKLNTDDAIESYNRVYIPLNNSIELIEAKARVIKANGEIITLDEDNIKSSEDLGEEGKFKFFAIEGIEKGSEIEYIIHLKNVPSLNGKTITLQSDEWRLDNTLQIFAPSNLEFAFKSLNGFPQVKLDTNYGDTTAYVIHIDTLEPIYYEDFSAYNASLTKVLFKLERNNYNKDLVNYGDVAENYWNNAHPELGKSTEKLLKKIMSKEIMVEDDWKEIDKIRAVESYIKTNIIATGQANTSEIEDAILNKYTTEMGITKLFCAFFDILEIEYQLGFTSNRLDLKFDQEFESYSFLEEEFMYFPKISKFLCPNEPFYRVGLLPAVYTDNYGLFIKNVTVGDYSSAVGKIEYIPAEPAETTQNLIDVQIDLNEDLFEPTINLTREFTGYTAADIQPIYQLMDQEDQESLNRELMKLPGETAEVIEYEVLNTEPADINVKPLVYKGQIKYPELIQKAGDKLLLKVGELIGPQSALYDEHERKLGVENDHNRIYERTITIKIPEGYTIENIDDLNVDIKELNNTALFVSSYEFTDQTLTVNVSEYYTQIAYPLSDYEAYRTVINAAANFNKIVLVIKK